MFPGQGSKEIGDRVVAHWQSRVGGGYFICLWLFLIFHFPFSIFHFSFFGIIQAPSRSVDLSCLVKAEKMENGKWKMENGK